jgi:hypothetical protein
MGSIIRGDVVESTDVLVPNKPETEAPAAPAAEPAKEEPKDEAKSE